jgi:hypothetical protein
MFTGGKQERKAVVLHKRSIVSYLTPSISFKNLIGARINNEDEGRFQKEEDHGCLSGCFVFYFTIDSFKNAIGNFPFIFLMEVIAIEAFGFLWITKGQTLWPDGQHYLARVFRK